MIEINNEKQLLKLLKGITRNALNESNQILSKDPYVEDLERGFEKNNSLYEQEEEDPAEEENTKTKNQDSSQKEPPEPESSSTEDKLTPAAKKALALPAYDSKAKQCFNIIFERTFKNFNWCC